MTAYKGTEKLLDKKTLQILPSSDTSSNSSCTFVHFSHKSSSSVDSCLTMRRKYGTSRVSCSCEGAASVATVLTGVEGISVVTVAGLVVSFGVVEFSDSDWEAETDRWRDPNSEKRLSTFTNM